MAALRWAVSLSSWKSLPEEWSRGMACIQVEERKRINEFVFWEDAALSLIGRLLLRAAVVTLMGVSNDVITFKRTDKGKPILDSISGCGQGCGLDLNVSHQGDYAVLAAVMEGGACVGVDVMECTRPRGITSIDDFFTTMTRQFTKGEWLQIKAPPTSQEQLKLFYRFWCLKESYIKAIGTGLSHGLQRLEFTVDPAPLSPWQLVDSREVTTNSKLSVDGIPQSEWRFEESFLNDKHCVAMATNGRSAVTSFDQVTVSELLTKLRPLHNEIDNHQWTLQSRRPFKNNSK